MKILKKFLPFSLLLFFNFAGICGQVSKCEEIYNELREMHPLVLDSDTFYEMLENTDEYSDEFIKDWHGAQFDYQRKYDELIIKKQELIVNWLWDYINNAFDQMPLDQTKLIVGLMEKMAIEYYKWHEHRKMLGDFSVERSKELSLHGNSISPQQLQKNRKYSFNNFITYAKAFLRYQQDGTVRTKDNFFMSGLKKMGDDIKLLTSSLFFSFVGIPTYLCSNLILNAPLARFAHRFLRQYPRMNSRYSAITIYGEENLDSLCNRSDEKEINLLLPSHRSAVGDLMLLAQLPIDNVLIFANAKVIGSYFSKEYSNYYGNLFAMIPELIPVGSCKGFFNQGTYEHLINAIENNVGYNIINFPQGFVADINEVLPITPVFVEKLVQRLISDGYIVNILPISFEVEGDLFLDNEALLHENLVIKVHPLLSHEQLLMILDWQKDNESLLELFLRAIWMDNIEAHSELSLYEIGNRLQRTFGVGNFFQQEI